MDSCSQCLEVICFGFGAAAPGQSYPSIYIVGWVNDVYGIWQSTNNAQSWTQIGTYPNSNLDEIKTISGDPNIYGQVYVGFSGLGICLFSRPPSVTGVAASPSSGIEVAGQVDHPDPDMTSVVTVTGTPTLTLNDGGTATYTSGSGTGALTFSYTVSAGTEHFGTGDHGEPIYRMARPSTTTQAPARVLTGAVTSFPVCRLMLGQDPS